MKPIPRRGEDGSPLWAPEQDLCDRFQLGFLYKVVAHHLVAR
jgi:hypothetical protein